MGMAHGNLSDLVFFALLAISAQWVFLPATLYQDIGPLKAQFTNKSADMHAIMTLGAGVILMIGLAFSGVKWNPINGKMAGFGAFITAGTIAYKSFKADSDVFVPRLFYVYAAVIAVGALHIMVLPSNPLPPKTKEVKNNHGNASDAVALSLIIASMGCLFYPEHLFIDLGPFKAQFSEKSADLETMIRFVACLMLTLALIISGVKWNPINGKMAGFGGFLASGYTAYSSFQADGGVFVPRIFYVYSAVIFFGGLHIFAFPSNPKPEKQSDKKKSK